MKKSIREILHLPQKSRIRKFTRSRVGNFFYFIFLFAAGAFSVLPMIGNVLDPVTKCDTNVPARHDYL